MPPSYPHVDMWVVGHGGTRNLLGIRLVERHKRGFKSPQAWVQVTISVGSNHHKRGFKSPSAWVQVRVDLGVQWQDLPSLAVAGNAYCVFVDEDVALVTHVAKSLLRHAPAVSELGSGGYFILKCCVTQIH